MGWIYAYLAIGFVVASFWSATAGADRTESLARVVAMSVLITAFWGLLLIYMTGAVIWIFASAICSHVARRFRR